MTLLHQFPPAVPSYAIHTPPNVLVECGGLCAEFRAHKKCVQTNVDDDNPRMKAVVPYMYREDPWARGGAIYSTYGSNGKHEVMAVPAESSEHSDKRNKYCSLWCGTRRDREENTQDGGHRLYGGSGDGHMTRASSRIHKACIDGDQWSELLTVGRVMVGKRKTGGKTASPQYARRFRTQCRLCAALVRIHH